jgi:hypothetical protein
MMTGSVPFYGAGFTKVTVAQVVLNNDFELVDIDMEGVTIGHVVHIEYPRSCHGLDYSWLTRGNKRHLRKSKKSAGVDTAPSDVVNLEAHPSDDESKNTINDGSNWI